MLADIVEADTQYSGPIWPLIGPSILRCRICLATTGLQRPLLSQKQSSLALGVPFTEHPRASACLDDEVGTRMYRHLQRCYTDFWPVGIGSEQVLNWGFNTCQTRKPRIPDPAPSGRALIALLPRHCGLDAIDCRTSDRRFP